MAGEIQSIEEHRVEILDMNQKYEYRVRELEQREADLLEEISSL